MSEACSPGPRNGSSQPANRQRAQCQNSSRTARATFQPIAHFKAPIQPHAQGGRPPQATSAKHYVAVGTHNNKSHVCRLGATVHSSPLNHPNSLVHSSDHEVRTTSSSPEVKPPELVVDACLLRHLERLYTGVRMCLGRPSQTWKTPEWTGPRNSQFPWMDRKLVDGVHRYRAQTRPLWPPASGRHMTTSGPSYPVGRVRVGLHPCRSRSGTPWCGRALRQTAFYFLTSHMLLTFLYLLLTSPPTCYWHFVLAMAFSLTQTNSPNKALWLSLSRT